MRPKFAVSWHRPTVIMTTGVLSVPPPLAYCPFVLLLKINLFILSQKARLAHLNTFIGKLQNHLRPRRKRKSLLSSNIRQAQTYLCRYISFLNEASYYFKNITCSWRLHPENLTVLSIINSNKSRQKTQYKHSLGFLCFHFAFLFSPAIPSSSSSHHRRQKASVKNRSSVVE